MQSASRGARRTAPPSLSIVIPIYNEAENIEPLWEELASVLAHYPHSEVIFVDDGSIDGSSVLLKALARRDKRVKVLRFSSNAGQTPALGAGVAHASGDIIVFMDGDRQNDPADIPRLLEKLEEGYDLVSGWRENRQDPLLRIMLSRGANMLIGAATGIRLHDYGCTLKAYRAELVKRLEFIGEVHRLLPVYARWQGARIAELPVNHRPRVAGTSKYGFSRIFKILFDLLIAQFTVRWRRRPMYFFGMLAVISFGLGLISIVVALLYKYFAGISLIQTPLPLLSAMLVILGMQMLSMGIVADLLLRTSDKQSYSIEETTGF